ncbi:GNAT family N-acetyltransferase [Parachitinimonas caeni]|uniref:GNAT family N-acetyltransferase n=1 Tax=Parachitinimonas caeni TaxID=3031301 RepID=A0ABT7E1M6_9NEIS|nr:GNAT family N-acetyltransferase [Parachitinimonas caeni]MDK2126217.1 GNAT family N-acetyltransferase [Parachitinimonas caeni]
MANIALVIPLGPRDRGSILEHLLALNTEDRGMRFGQSVDDQAIERYVAQLDFARDAFYGVYQRNAEKETLVACLQLAIDRHAKHGEIGVSVDAAFRRKGIAGRMLERATLHASNIGLSEVVMYFMPYNSGLIELAKRCGMSLSVGNGEGIARLANLRPTPASVANELAEVWGVAADAVIRDAASGLVESTQNLRRYANAI